MIKILDRSAELVTMISRTAKNGGVIERMNIKVTGNVEEMHNLRELLARSLELFLVPDVPFNRRPNAKRNNEEE